MDDCVLGDKQCYHNGTCVDLEGDYRCDCQPGWTGKRCDVQVRLRGGISGQERVREGIR